MSKKFLKKKVVFSFYNVTPQFPRVKKKKKFLATRPICRDNILLSRTLCSVARAPRACRVHAKELLLHAVRLRHGNLLPWPSSVTIGNSLSRHRTAQLCCNMKIAMSRHRTSWPIPILSRQRNLCHHRMPRPRARACSLRPPVAHAAPCRARAQGVVAECSSPIVRSWVFCPDTSLPALSQHKGPRHNMEPKIFVTT